MQQRQLRLGDILDDYCPRERRLANHTIVAMVGNEIRLTRCTTCDTEHPYKGGKAPRLRKKTVPVPAEASATENGEGAKQEQPGTLVSHALTEEAEPMPAAASDNGGAPEESNGGPPELAPEEVRLHRPLIRAQLPRIEREPAARPVPEFTIRQANKRQGRFQNSRPGRFAKGGGGGPMNRQGGGNSRGPEGRQGGRPQGNDRSPMRSGRPPGQHSGKKRSR